MDEYAADTTADRDFFPVLRETELDELIGAVNAARRRGGLLTVAGAAGAGKTTLVELVARRFAADGGRVLRADSSQSETHLPFSGLHQLLRPVRKKIDALPPRQRRALHTVFGLAEHGEAPDPMLIGIAVLTLLSDVAVDQPLLLVVDDAHWTDRASLDALSFVTRRLADEPVTVVIVTRDGALPSLGARQSTIHLGPLAPAAAGRLLDLQLPAPTGLIRARILEQAEGNALALEELARAAAEHAQTAYDTDGPLPITDSLERIYAARLAALPTAGRRAVVRLATADTKDPPRTVLSWLPDIGDPVWAAAENAGLVRRSGGQLRCENPLSRIAIYHAAPDEERRAAHLELAELFRGQDLERYAWHLAAATSGLSAHVSAELENSADRARHRSGYAAAAHMLERAADLHPDPGETTRLLATATGTAVLTGRLDSVERLAARTRASTDDPTVAALAALQVGRLMTLTTSHNTAFGHLMRAAGDLADSHPAATLEALAAAAVVRFYSGDPAQLQEIERILPAASAALAHPPAEQEPFLAKWVKVVAQPRSIEPHVVLRLPALASAAAAHPETLTLLAVAAWLLDETDLAVRVFDTALASWAVKGPLPDGLGGIAALAYLEHGRWPRAHQACAELSALATEIGLDHAAACADATDGLLCALRGDAAGARVRARHALSLIDPVESRSVFVIAHRALGTAAAAEGDHETAYLHFRELFDGPGNAVHYHLSHPALPELASAAARSGHHEEAARIVDGAVRSFEDAGPLLPRRAALVHLSRAVLAPPGEAESHFTQALEAPVLARRPFEHAQTLLAYGEWLRRRRRIVEARASLAEAEGIFRRLGARPGTARAQTELRAAGARSNTAEPGAFADLTPQQQQIVRLAARGLTNREVAERLYLSPRTVSSHLYRAFPKLGITVRSQLRDVVEAHIPDSVSA